MLAHGALACWLIGAATGAVAGDYLGELVEVVDTSTEVKFQDFDHVGHHSRGRALLVADFDNDGRPDAYIGNPGERSILLRNVDLGGGDWIFEFREDRGTLLDGVLAWGAATADYDNDGDLDIFVSAGGNECQEFDHLLRNELIPSGVLSFRDLSVIDALPEEARIRGRIEGGGVVGQMASANAVWADYDNDGWLDLFVNANTKFQCGFPQQGDGSNVLWHNEGIEVVDGREVVLFSDATEATGIGAHDRASRHSFFFDYDNDGDLDLFEMNFKGSLDEPDAGENVLWRNELAETGAAFFTDVTDLMAGLGDDVRFPINSFAACPGDLNNDGWEDLVVLMRGTEPSDAAPGSARDCADWLLIDVEPNFSPLEDEAPVESAWDPPSEPESGGGSPFGTGHAIFINQGGQGFLNEAELLGVNERYVEKRGVMGSQLGDLNGDGVLDLYIGNGGPGSGQHDNLLLSDPLRPVTDPRYDDLSPEVSFPVDPPPGQVAQAFPYRTHGTAIADVDRDGMTELLVVNGGPADASQRVREPNRVFEFAFDSEYSFLRVQLEGDGVHVNRSALGARVAVTAGREGVEPWTVHRTLYSGTCFSATNGHELFFGLRNADRVEEVHVIWPDGATSIVTDAVLNETLTVRR